MTDHSRYESMLHAAMKSDGVSAQAPLHDDLPPFVEAPLRVDGVRYPIDGSVIVQPISTLLPSDVDDPPLSWSYERATD